MSHRIVSAVIGVVLLLFGGSAVLFAVGETAPRKAGAPPGAPVMSHGITGDHASCPGCHAPGGAGPAMPPTHRTFAASSCLGCHRPAR